MVSEAIVELFHTNGSFGFGGSARICWFAFLRAPLTVSGKPTWALGSRKFWPARTSSGANSPKSSWEATSRGRRDDARPVPAFISHRRSWFGWPNRDFVAGWGVHSFLNGIHGFFVVREHEIDYSRNGKGDHNLSWRDFLHLHHHLYILSTIFFILNPGSCTGLGMFPLLQLELLALEFFLRGFSFGQYSMLDQMPFSRTKVPKIPQVLYISYQHLLN